MKKILIGTLILCVMIFTSSCTQVVKGRREIDHNLFIQTTAFDKGENDRVRVTIISKSMHSDAAAETSEKEAHILTHEGQTIFEVGREFDGFASKDVFWGHLEFVVISEEAAKEGLLKYIDFIIRDHEVRLTPKVIIVRDVTGEEMIKKINTSTFDVSEKLDNIFEDAGLLSYSSEITLADIISMATSEYTCIHAPTVKLVQKTEGGKEDKGKYDPYLDGYAIFKNEKLVGYLTEKRARGLNWILNKVDSGVIVVKDKEEQQISMEIIESKTKVIPKISDGKLTITVEIKMSSNIAEYEGSENIFTESAIDHIKHQIKDQIEKEVKDAIKYAKENGADFLQFGDAVYHKYPIKWDIYKDNWEDEFKNVPVKISVKTRINRTYVIKNPIGYREK